MKKTNDKNTNNPLFFIIMLPYNLLKYLVKGFVALSYIFYSFWKYLIKYLVWGYVVISYYFYLLFAWPFKLIGKYRKSVDNSTEKCM